MLQLPCQEIMQQIYVLVQSSSNQNTPRSIKGAGKKPVENDTNAENFSLDSKCSELFKIFRKIS